MKRRTVGLIATAGIIIVGAVYVVGRGGGGLPVDTQPAARKAVFRASVTASGQVVAQRYADIGSSVMGRLVELRVKEDDAVEAGQILARLDAVQAAASAAAREFRVKVRLDNPDRRLRPGLTCDAEVLTAERRNVLAVPLQAVVVRSGANGEERTGGFVADGGAARFQPVTPGLIGGLDIEVSGLAEGTAVVVGPFQALRELQDGQAVRTRASS